MIGLCMRLRNFRSSYACSKSGHLFEVDVKNVTLVRVRKLLPITDGRRQTGEVELMQGPKALSSTQTLV